MKPFKALMTLALLTLAATEANAQLFPGARARRVNNQARLVNAQTRLNNAQVVNALSPRVVSSSCRVNSVGVRSHCVTPSVVVPSVAAVAPVAPLSISISNHVTPTVIRSQALRAQAINVAPLSVLQHQTAYSAHVAPLFLQQQAVVQSHIQVPLRIQSHGCAALFH